MPYAFREMSKYTTSYYRPGEQAISEDRDLDEAINAWLGYIRSGKAEPVDSTALDEVEFATTKVLSELRIRSTVGAKLHPLVDSGFGYSQLLPIILRGLSAPKWSTIIIEQPELHLNPALQVRLAEFLVSLVRADKQVIIETHSEHIVNAIRVLAAEDEKGELWDKCQITYVDSAEDTPVVRELSILPDGTMPDLPASFFGEATRLSTRLLKAQRRFFAQRKEDD